MMNEEVREEMVLTKLNQTKINVLGPVRREFEESKKEVKLKQQAHFKDETMTGNAAHEVFNDFRKGKNTLLNCFKPYPQYYQKHLKLFQILTKIDTLLCSSGKKTLEQREETALALEEFGLYFPVHFKRNLTRKMHLLSFSAPKQIREHGDWYRYLRLEQETERAHHELNLLEEEFRSVKNKAQKYYLMLKAFKNKQKIDKGVVVPRKRV